MSIAGTRTVTVDEYLANPAYEHCEYIDGEVMELNVGTGNHGGIQFEFAWRFKEYLKVNPIGHTYGDLHCRLNIGGRTRYRLPDACVILGPRIQGYPEKAPELCVEIRSPEDSVADQIAKFEDYFANGCRLGWLVLPEESSVLILTPGAAPRAAREGDTLDGGDVLPGLQIPVSELFA